MRYPHPCVTTELKIRLKLETFCGDLGPERWGIFRGHAFFRLK